MSKTTLTFSKLPLHPLSRCEHPKILSCLLHRQRSEQLSSPIHLKSVKKFYALKVFLMLLFSSEFLEKQTSNTYTLFLQNVRWKIQIVCCSQTHYFFCKILRAQNRKKIWCFNSFNDRIKLFLPFCVNLVNFRKFHLPRYRHRNRCHLIHVQKTGKPSMGICEVLLHYLQRWTCL